MSLFQIVRPIKREPCASIGWKTTTVTAYVLGKQSVIFAFPMGSCSVVFSRVYATLYKQYCFHGNVV